MQPVLHSQLSLPLLRLHNCCPSYSAFTGLQQPHYFVLSYRNKPRDLSLNFPSLLWNRAIVNDERFLFWRHDCWHYYMLLTPQPWVISIHNCIHCRVNISYKDSFMNLKHRFLLKKDFNNSLISKYIASNISNSIYIKMRVIITKIKFKKDI